ncbi:MAG: hypothetical protein K1W33_06815 [Clostridia bacterium]
MDNTTNIVTINPSVALRNAYNYYGIPYDCNIDEINLIISNKGYINEIDEDGLFAIKEENEYLKFGDIWIDFLNIFKTPFCYDFFYPLYIKMQNKYEDICSDFVKEFYSELLSISGCSSLVAQSLIDHIVWNVRYKNIKFSQLNFEDCFKILAFFNPKTALNNFECSPQVAYFKTTLAEVDGKSYFVHHALEAYTLLSIDIINCRTHDISILQCKHCHKYFVQKHKNNLKYCDICKALSDKERRNDKFENLYRKVYGRLRGKSRSMIDDNEKNKYINGVFYRWTVEVIEQKKIYKQNDDFEGFKAYIENAEKNIGKF